MGTRCLLRGVVVARLCKCEFKIETVRIGPVHQVGKEVDESGSAIGVTGQVTKRFESGVGPHRAMSVGWHGHEI